MNVDSGWCLRDSIGGDIQRIQSASLQELLTWRNIRGRTVTHVAAACSQAGAWVGENFDFSFPCVDGRFWKDGKYACQFADMANVAASFLTGLTQQMLFAKPWIWDDMGWSAGSSNGEGAAPYQLCPSQLIGRGHWWRCGMDVLLYFKGWASHLN